MEKKLQLFPPLLFCVDSPALFSSINGTNFLKWKIVKIWLFLVRSRFYLFLIRRQKTRTDPSVSVSKHPCTKGCAGMHSFLLSGQKPDKESLPKGH
jgi:hypothetical protein